MLMERRRVIEGVLLAVILGITAVFRFTSLDWDQYRHFHPDERYISWVATTIEPPNDWSTAFVPHLSSFNPFYWSPDADSDGIIVPQDEQRAFAYGHVPLYLGVAATKLAERVAPFLAPRLPQDWLLTTDLLNTFGWVEYLHLTAVSRALTALFDTGTVLLLYWLGRRLYGAAVGLLAAALLALNVMHIQLAHYFISDPYLTFFIVAALTCWVAALQTQRGRWVWLGCVLMGLAIGSKFAAVLLALPLLILVWAMWQKRWLWRLVLAGLIVAATFAVTNPFAVIDYSCELVSKAVSIGPVRVPELDWGSCFVENITTQGAMVRGDSDLPFTRQYSGTTPYLYYIEMQLKWGMGLLLGLMSFAGFGWVLWQGGKPLLAWVKAAGGKRPFIHLNQLRQTVRTHPELLLLAWCVPYFISTGSFFVKFMRYMQPLTPFLTLFGAAMVWRWKRPLLRYGTIAAVLLFTLLHALAFRNMYQTPHPWLAASQWIYENLAEDTLILSEQWDDHLPSSMFLPDGTYRRRAEYANDELTWLTRADEKDTVEKLEANVAHLVEADYLVITSNRIYGVVPRLPERYSLSSQYHQLLFDGSLGYEPIFIADRAPNLWGWRLQAETFAVAGLEPPTAVSDHLANQRSINMGQTDESFTVYDQPLTIIFEKQTILSEEEMIALFDLGAGVGE